MAETMKADSSVFIYNSSKDLWNDLIGEWKENEDSVLVFPSEISKELFLSKYANDTILGKRVMVLGDLWHQVAKALKELNEEKRKYSLPNTVSAERLLILAKEIIDKEKLENLASLNSDEDLLVLLDYIDRIEETVDYSFDPLDPLNKDINYLKNSFHDLGQTSIKGFYSAASRQTNLVSLPYSKIIFAPFREYTPQTGGLLKGLSLNHLVSTYLLSAKTSKDDLLRSLALTPESLEKSSAQLKIEDRLLASEELSFFEIIENNKESQIRSAIGKEKAQVILAVPNTERWLPEALREAGRKNRSLVYRGLSKANSFVIVDILLKLNNPDSLISWRDEDNSLILSVDSNQFDLSELKSDIEDLFASYNINNFEININGLNRLEFLYKFGNILDKQFEYINAPWLNRLLDLVNVFRLTIEENNISESGVEKIMSSETISRILSSNRTQPKMFGTLNESSVLLVGYNDLAALSFNQAKKCLLGFNDDSFDANIIQPFSNRDLLEIHPELKINSFWHEINSALLLQPLIVRDESSPLLSLQAQKEETFRLQTEKSEWRFPPLEELLVDSLDRPLSISELISLTSCSLGWYVDYQMKPYRTDRQAIDEGELMHSILEEFPESYREVRNKIEEKGKDLFLTNKELDLFTSKVWRLADTYNFIAADLTTHSTEEEITGKIELNLGGDVPKEINLRGRIDRIDWNEEKDEFLIVDYKRGGAPDLREAWQILLYPEMLRSYYKEHFNKDIACRGSIYLSAKTGQASGFYRKEKDGYAFLYERAKDKKHFSDWTNGKSSYLAKYKQLIEKISEELTELSANRSLRAGKDCRDYCSHYCVEREYTL